MKCNQFQRLEGNVTFWYIGFVFKCIHILQEIVRLIANVISHLFFTKLGKDVCNKREIEKPMCTRTTVNTYRELPVQVTGTGMSYVDQVLKYTYLYG